MRCFPRRPLLVAYSAQERKENEKRRCERKDRLVWYCILCICSTQWLYTTSFDPLWDLRQVWCEWQLALTVCVSKRAAGKGRSKKGEKCKKTEFRFAIDLDCVHACKEKRKFNSFTLNCHHVECVLVVFSVCHCVVFVLVLCSLSFLLFVS